MVKGGKLFGKRLPITNGTLSILTTTLYLSNGSLDNSDFKLMAEFARDPAMLKTSNIISLLVISPCIALIWTTQTTINSIEIN